MITSPFAPLLTLVEPATLNETVWPPEKGLFPCPPCLFNLGPKSSPFIQVFFGQHLGEMHPLFFADSWAFTPLPDVFLHSSVGEENDNMPFFCCQSSFRTCERCPPFLPFFPWGPGLFSGEGKSLLYECLPLHFPPNLWWRGTISFCTFLVLELYLLIPQLLCSDEHFGLLAS